MTASIGASGKAPATRPAWIRGCLALGLLAMVAACTQDVVLPGERFSAREPLAETLEDASDARPGNTTRPFSAPSVQRVADWGQRGLDTRNRLPHLGLSASLTPVWVADIGEGNSRRQRITADPVAAGGLVFTIDADSMLQATSLSNGAAAWTVSLVPDFDRGGGISGGGLAVSGGVVYATTGYGEVVALDAGTGAVRWRQRLNARLGAPTVNGNILYVIASDSQAWSIDARDGRIRWQIPVAEAPSILSGGAAPAVAGRAVILPFPTGEIQAVFPDSGARLWGTFVAGGRPGAAYAQINDITADPVVVGNTIYIGNQSGRVVAIDARLGDTRWVAREGAYSPVVVAGDNLFFVSDRNELIRLDASDGTRIWGTELPLFEALRERRRKAVFTHYGPLLAGGRLLVASGDGLIRFFAPDSGALVGSVEIDGGAASHPIIVNDTLLVVSAEGRLHAYR